MKIAIIEDDAIMASEIKEMLKVSFHFDEADIDLYPSGVALLKEFQKQYAILFMDIQMEMLNGIETSCKIREIDKQVILIFITSMEQFAIQGYQVDAFRYLLKPLDQQEFNETMEKAFERIQRQKNRMISLKSLYGTVIVNAAEILFAEIKQRQLWIYTSAQSIPCNMSLNHFEKLLSHPHFYRCHEGYLVNMEKIFRLGKNEIELVNHQHIPLSRLKKQDFLQAFTQCLKERSDV